MDLKANNVLDFTEGKAVLSPNNKVYFPIIGILSLVVAGLVATLFSLKEKGGMDVRFLPHLNAVLNTGTSIALVLGFVYVRRLNIKMHRTMMATAFGLSSLFLVSYVFYHYNIESTRFPKDNPFKYLYYFVLLTHVLLSAIVVPLVLTSIYFALSNQISRHRAWVKYTFPIWLYVSITGVIVYLMISPYYK